MSSLAGVVSSLRVIARITSKPSGKSKFSQPNQHPKSTPTLTFTLTLTSTLVALKSVYDLLRAVCGRLRRGVPTISVPPPVIVLILAFFAGAGQVVGLGVRKSSPGGVLFVMGGGRAGGTGRAGGNGRAGGTG